MDVRGKTTAYWGEYEYLNVNIILGALQTSFKLLKFSSIKDVDRD